MASSLLPHSTHPSSTNRSISIHPYVIAGPLGNAVTEDGHCCLCHLLSGNLGVQRCLTCHGRPRAGFYPGHQWFMWVIFAMFLAWVLKIYVLLCLCSSTHSHQNASCCGLSFIFPHTFHLCQIILTTYCLLRGHE